MTHNMLTHALTLSENGYIVLRAELKSKATLHQGWQTEMPTAETLMRNFARPSNLGVRCGDIRPDGTCLVAIDIDIEEAELIRCVERAIGVKVPIKRGRKGYTYFIRVDRETKTGHLTWQRDGKKVQAIDIIAKGAQTILPPSIHPDTGLPYQWISKETLLTTNYRTLPVFGPSILDEIKGFCKSAEDPIFALNDMIWAGVGNGGNTHDTCVAAVSSMSCRGWSDEEITARIHRAKHEACERAGLPYHWPEADKVIQEWIDSARQKFGQSDRKQRRPSHGTLADDFLPQARDHFLYDRDLGCWYFFDGSYWRAQSGHQLRYAIDRFVPDELRNNQFISGVEASLRNRPEFTMRQKDWNPNRHFLGVPGWVVDLKTSATRPCYPTDLITRSTAVAPADSYAGSLWIEKVVEWVGEDPEELAYFQKLAGLFLIGGNPEACLPLWIGPGGDGKSVIANTYRYILGDYAQTSTDTAFLESRHGQHHEEVAWLKDARLVLVNEINGGLPWNDARIKAVTGGESQSASFKGGHLFEFQPEFKLLITGNEPPSLRSVGPEFRRRFHVLKFTKGVADPDPHLSEKLRTEAGSILRWMIEGARMVIEEGLTPSPSVRAATAEYFEENDTIQQWINECAELRPDYRSKGDLVYQNYLMWAEAQGFRYPLTRMKLTQKLKIKSIISDTASLPGEMNSVRCYFGLRLRGDELPGY